MKAVEAKTSDAVTHLEQEAKQNQGVISIQPSNPV